MEIEDGNALLVSITRKLKSALAEANDIDASAEGENAANFKHKRAEYDKLTTEARYILDSFQ